MQNRFHPDTFYQRKLESALRWFRWIPAVAGMAALMLGAEVNAQEIRTIRSITVSGMAERKVVPDEAHIQVNLNAQDKDMAKARAAHQQKLAKLMGIVKAADIDEKKVRSQNSNVQPVYNYNSKNERGFQGYRVQTDLDITVGDTKKLGALIDAISSAGFEQGANTEWGNLINTYYTLSDPDKIRDEMLTQAIANAHAKAERMANAAGADLGEVYQINEQGTPQFIPVIAAAPAMAMKAEVAADMAPPAGEQQVQSNVTVTYELK